jgi:putative zinc finger/helix-turn-helix YgiT family protein
MMMTRHQKPIPDDACPECGMSMGETRGTLTYPVNGERVRVPGVTYLQCPREHDPILDVEHARYLREGAFTRYRKRYGLLSATEIRALRNQLGLTQGALATLLRLGGNTLSRWESGRNVQTAAMDLLLRMLRDVPGSLAYVRRRVA